MNKPWINHRPAIRAVTSVLLVSAVILTGSCAAWAQSGLAPFTPPPSAPGITWSQDVLKKLKFAQWNMERAAKKGDAKDYARGAAEVGALHSAVSDWNVALVYCQHRLAAAESVNDLEHEATILNNLGNAQGKLGQISAM